MNREKYLERVLDMIIKDSHVEGKDIIYPFHLPMYSLQTNFYLPLHENFLTYCRDQYGLSEEECKEIWYDYTMTMVRTVDYEDYVDYSRTTPLDEIYLHGNLEPEESDPKKTLSIYGFNSEGHYKFFMRVYKRIIDSIEIIRDDSSDIIWFYEFDRTKEGLFGLRLWMADGDPREDFKTFSESYTDYILRCCMDLMTEGLPDGGQYVSFTLTDMVLKYIYENVFQNRILQRKFNLNESEDRMDRFVDKVLQFLKDDTYQIEDNLIYVPFLDKPVSISYEKYSGHNVLDMISYIDEPPKPFTRYCIDTYGLDPQYINSVWDQYRVFIMENFHKLTKRY